MNVYQQRRTNLAAKIGENSLAILFAAPEQRRSNDTFYPYRQNSYFHYLCGFPEPEAVLMIEGGSARTTLFCREKDPLRETWDGFRYGPEAAKEAFALEQAFAVAQWQTYLAEALKTTQTIYLLNGLYPEHDQTVFRIWYEAQKLAGQRAATLPNQAPQGMMSLAPILDSMRLIKDEHEIALLRQAADISAKAHIRAIQACRVGMYEYQLEAELLHEMMQHGAQAVAYNSIVGGGKNSCCLHYVSNRDVLQDGEMVLIDAGAEYQGYAGDITRTFPVNGRFSPAQRDVYQIVLAANKNAIASCHAGADWQAINEAASRILTQGLIDLKLLSGSLEQNLEEATYRRFYMHGLGHWIGLDVHDVGRRFDAQGQSIRLAEGMCTTIEPGLYIGGEADIPAEFRHIGIRIEDNILIQKEGCEVYTQRVPKEIAAIEALMQH